MRRKFIMVGGFLGAGKTTILIAFARWLVARGKRVAIITNDQAQGLVDTILTGDASLNGAEISGGCFCCKTDELVRLTDELSAEHSPDIFLAEPVGSCTDLIATVSLPLNQIYGKDFDVAPMVVLVDPTRAIKILDPEVGANGRCRLSSDVEYIYRKQIEEAEIIVVNKTDTVTPDKLNLLQQMLETQFPVARIVHVAARADEGLDSLFQTLSTSVTRTCRTLELDYSRYGRGEEHLGWFNGVYSLTSSSELDFDGNGILECLTEVVRTECLSRAIEIGHLKIALQPSDTVEELGAIQCVSSACPPEFTKRLVSSMGKGMLTINLRAEGEANILTGIVESALTCIRGVAVQRLRADAFQPSFPTPLHRVTQQ